MNKKVVIGIVAVIVIAIIIAGVAIFVLSNPKTKPEDIWQQYISNINEQKYQPFDMLFKYAANLYYFL